MDKVGSVLGVAFFAYVIWAVLSGAVEHLRDRSRLVSTMAEVVDTRDASARPGVVRRSAVFRFTAQDGRSYEVTSSGSALRGPKVGSLIPVRYDPGRPQRAERNGVIIAKLWLALPVTVVGVVGIVLNVRNLR
ncbi:DUF3592 domain-containing protein [Kitasatospora sp. NPDC096147]|uniref:DUF3592 domain-containing protein n=1 Tax=Kitasatospora sp. NPDC096147 TaxID=3364093 RepID=UPI0038271B52